MDERLEIESRQRVLPLNMPSSALIVGIGGVGSWVALDLALIGVQDLYLVDFDTIELSNLNRTPFKISQVDMLKVDALAQLIYERRPNVSVNPINYKMENIPRNLLEIIKDVEVVVDCRDNMIPALPKILINGEIICGYDGFNVTIHRHPKLHSVIATDDEPVTYSVTPSFVVPPLNVTLDVYVL